MVSFLHYDLSFIWLERINFVKQHVVLNLKIREKMRVYGCAAIASLAKVFF